MRFRFEPKKAGLFLAAFSVVIASCSAENNPSPEEVVAHFEDYLGDLDYEFKNVSLPRQGGSEGALFKVYQDTGTVSVIEIRGFITYGVWINRLLSDEGYPDLLAVRRLQWNPDAYPDELIVEYDEIDLFVQNSGEWEIFLHDGGYPLERIPRLIERFDAAVEFMASNES